MLNPIFSSSKTFKQHFIQNLQDILSIEDFGTFILVLANALSNADIHQSLSTDLSHHFSLLKDKLKQLSTTEGQQIPADDLAVFTALSKFNLHELSQSSHRSASIWQLQFNPLRSFRPARNSQKSITQLYQPFNQNSFHFNKSFLSREIIWQGLLSSIPVRLLYNKFPFADYHGLLVIEPELEKPQFLNYPDCLKTQRVLTELSHLKGIGLAYNSLAAYASVNHQHWQLFLSEKNYPVEHSQWSHHSGAIDYPLNVEHFNSLINAWPQIKSYQKSNTAFNLIARPDNIYLVKRKKQGEYQHNGWTSGFAWSEIMGNFMTSSQQYYNELDSQIIEQELCLLQTH